jgi:hypothetical protein
MKIAAVAMTAFNLAPCHRNVDLEQPAQMRSRG